MKVKITVPESLDDIKLKDFQKFAKVQKENPDADGLLKLKMIEYFCGLKLKDIRMISAKDVEDIINDINASFESKKPLKKFFKFQGVEYGFIPNLEEISFGEYMDLDTYLADVENLHKAMAVLYRPVTQKVKDMYLIEDYEGSDKYSDIMREAPLSVYLGAQVFFYNLGKELVRGTMSCLQAELMTNSELKSHLQDHGVGTTQFMQSLEGILLNTNISLN